MKLKRKPPPVGSTYEKTLRNGKKFVLTVVKVNGEVKYKVGQKIFNSPSAAAKHVYHGYETNGWLFWRIESEF